MADRPRTVTAVTSSGSAPGGRGRSGQCSTRAGTASVSISPLSRTVRAGGWAHRCSSRVVPGAGSGRLRARRSPVAGACRIRRLATRGQLLPPLPEWSQRSSSGACGRPIRAAARAVRAPVEARYRWARNAAGDGRKAVQPCRLIRASATSSTRRRAAHARHARRGCAPPWTVTRHPAARSRSGGPAAPTGDRGHHRPT
jgi:hypothetical protein